ncbi:MAG TPA: hypothetical protein VNH38_00860 [Candidatus Dormibacteraeota bacterium]|jgi:AcrR family transcriptional regulator|nr:hypothetical protein [Candidatus Dormibacteraeota bacterium]
MFYAEGLHTVGVDWIVERAGIAKAPLKTILGSKEGLVSAYLLDRRDQTRERTAMELTAWFHTPRERLFGVFEVQGLGSMVTVDPTSPWDNASTVCGWAVVRSHQGGVKLRLTFALGRWAR